MISTALHIAWSYSQQNAKIGIAENTFLDAGAGILYIVNLILALRIMRARQARLGWSKIFTALIWLLVLLTVISIVMLVVVVAQSFLASQTNILRIDRDIELFVLTWLAWIAFAPLLLTTVALVLPRRNYIDKFGTGRFRWKPIILITASTLLTLGAGWRCGTTFASPLQQIGRRPWYFTSACYYVFALMPEVIVIILYLAIRIDLRFHVPDGADGPGSYSGATVDEKDPQWPETVYLPVAVQDNDGLGAPVVRQDFLQVDPRTGQYQLSRPQDSRHSTTSSLESRRGMQHYMT